MAFIGALACVETHMVTEGGGLAEAAVAEAADKWLVQGVYAHVGAQVAAGVEAAVADDAAHAAGCGQGGSGDSVAQVELISFRFLLLFFLCARDSWDAQEGVVGIPIPHKQFLIWRYCLYCFVKYAASDLHDLQVLFLLIARAFDVSHPAAMILLTGIDEIAHSAIFIENLPHEIVVLEEIHMLG